MAVEIVVTEHAGWPERRTGVLIPGLHEIPSTQGPTTIVSLDNGEIHAVPSEHVFTRKGLAYAEEWATKTHSSIREIFIPEALRVP